VIGDVHGCHQSLLNLLAVLPSGDHLVFLGDVINRGAATEATMDLVWDLVRLGRATWLRGNHEQDLIDALQSSNQDESQHHLMLDTYKQLGEERAKQWLQRLLQLPSAYRADGWIATHAGFNSHGEPDLSIRDPFWESYDGRFGLVVIGHTPRPQVERVGRIVLIDTGAVYGGLLSAFCPETDAVVQVPGASCSTSFPRPQDEGRIQAVLAGEPSTC
jgi:serine/threonine protein phosphatase 1